MPGINTTGRANPNDYNLGRGKVYFSSLGTSPPSTDLPLGYRDLGNATEFNVTVESETLEHQSSREGLKVVDKEVIVSQKLSLSVTLDEVNFQNLALFMSGATASHTNATTPTLTTVAANTHLGEGYWMDLVDQNGVRCYDVASVAFDVTEHGGAGTVDTDFLLDKPMGRIFLIVGQSNLSNVTAADDIKYTVTMAASKPASVDEVRGLTQTSIAGALKFVAENPANADAETEFEFHKVSLKAEGDFGLISDEFSTMTLTGAAEKNEVSSPSSPTLTIRSFSGGTSQ